MATVVDSSFLACHCCTCTVSKRPLALLERKTDSACGSSGGFLKDHPYLPYTFIGLARNEWNNLKVLYKASEYGNYQLYCVIFWICIRVTGSNTDQKWDNPWRLLHVKGVICFGSIWKGDHLEARNSHKVWIHQIWFLCLFMSSYRKRNTVHTLLQILNPEGPENITKYDYAVL